MPVKHGVMIIGGIDIMMWVQYAARGDFRNFILYFVTTVTFMLMLVNDTKLHRLVYYVSFLGQKVIQQSLLLYNTVLSKYLAEDKTSYEQQAALKNYCSKVKESQGGTFEHTAYSDLDDCMQQTQQEAQRISDLTLLIVLALTVHFVLVVRQNYKNSDLPEAIGGCSKPPGFGEMNDLRSVRAVGGGVLAAVSDRTVEHAEDDCDLDADLDLSL